MHDNIIYLEWGTNVSMVFLILGYFWRNSSSFKSTCLVSFFKNPVEGLQMLPIADKVTNVPW